MRKAYHTQPAQRRRFGAVNPKKDQGLMGHFKGEGICYSGRCTNPGSIACGEDINGDPVVHCPACHDRTCRALIGEAQKIALELCQPEPGRSAH